MTATGAVPINFRGDGPWRGMTTQSRALPGMFELLENCYVSSDGSEIRPIPGFRTYIDLSAPRTTLSGSAGYEVDVIDSRRSVYATAASTYNFNTGATETMRVWASKTQVHGFEFVGGRIILFGESGFRHEPIFNSGSSAYVEIVSYAWDGAVGTILTFNQNYLQTGANFNSIPVAPPTQRANYRLYISGLTGPGGGVAILNDKAHTVDSVSPTGGLAANQIHIATNLVNAGNNAAGQHGFASWVSVDYQTSVNSPSDDLEELTIWTVLPDPVAPQIPALPLVGCAPAWVANRQRDFGDAVGIFDEGGSTGASRRRKRSVPYRLVPSVAGDRLLLAAPAYNCVFQAPVTIPVNNEGANPVTNGITWVTNDIYDKPRALGVPKAIMYEDTVKTSAANSANLYSAATAPFAFGGSGNTTRTGRYKFAVSYKDTVTGEEGLPSETITITTDDTNVNCGIRLIVMFPGYLMPECLALTVNVYRTQKNGEQLFFDRTIPMDAFSTIGVSPLNTLSAKYGVQPGLGVNDYRHCVEIRVPYTSDEILKKHTGAPPVLNQMPMGCKAVHTMRGGWTVYGGAMGNHGRNYELWKSAGIAQIFDAAAGYPNSDEVFGRIGVNTSAGFGLSGFESWGTGAQGTVPPAYMGQELFSRDLFPYPRETVLMNKIVNNVAASTAGVVPLDQLRDVRIQIDKSPLFENLTTSRTLQTTYLKMPRARLQISEADNPGVTPATNVTPIGKETGEDVEGVGEANGQLVACTRGKTYIIGFSQSPIGAPPELATDQFGCCAANTMRSFDFGVAWVSDRGPCAVMGGSFKWIGEQIQHFFAGVGARYLRDKTGMMRHAFSAHDPERGLIYFGMFADRADGTSNEVAVIYRGNSITWGAGFQNDEAQSRFPCDEILVYSYRVDSWSVWRPPLNLSIKWMARGIDPQSGKPGMFFLGSDDRIYLMDDSFSQWNTTPPTATVMAASTGTVIATNGTFGTDTAARGNDTFWIAGMEVLVISQQEGRKLIKRTTLTSISGSNVTVADAVTVDIGDTVQIGARAFTVKTNYLSPKMAETMRSGRSCIRFSLDGPTNATAYIKAGVDTTQVQDSEAIGINDLFTKADIGFDSYDLIGKADATMRVMDHAFANGRTQGTNVRLTLDVVGGAAVRLQDLYAEAQ